MMFLIFLGIIGGFTWLLLRTESRYNGEDVSKKKKKCQHKSREEDKPQWRPKDIDSIGAIVVLDAPSIRRLSSSYSNEHTKCWYSIANTGIAYIVDKGVSDIDSNIIKSVKSFGMSGIFVGLKNAIGKETVWVPIELTCPPTSSCFTIESGI